jgi:hypothetical protein
MKYFYLLVILCLFAFPLQTSAQVDSILTRVDAALENDLFDKSKYEYYSIAQHKYGNPDSYLMDPITVGQMAFFRHHTWAKWKEALNYREDEIPKSINIFLGGSAYRNNDSEIKPIKIESKRFYPSEYLEFNDNGDLLLQVGEDSLIFKYDEFNLLREARYYYAPGDIESIRLYNYDTFGNLLNHSLFFENEEQGIYLSAHSDYTYFPCDSGLYVKVTTKQLSLTSDTEYDTNYSYYFYTMDGTLRSSYEKMYGRDRYKTDVTHYSYEKRGGTSELIREETRSFDQPNAIKLVTRSFDLNNRLIEQFIGFKYGPCHSANIDSFFYFPNEVTQSAKYEFNSPNCSLGSSDGLKELRIEQYDSYGNVLIDSTADDATSRQTASFRLDGIGNYKYLENGTWYYKHFIYGPSGEFPKKFHEYVYRKCSYENSNFHPGVYLVDEILTEILYKIMKPD